MVVTRWSIIPLIGFIFGICVYMSGTILFIRLIIRGKTIVLSPNELKRILLLAIGFFLMGFGYICNLLWHWIAHSFQNLDFIAIFTCGEMIVHIFWIISAFCMFHAFQLSSE